MAGGSGLADGGVIYNLSGEVNLETVSILENKASGETTGTAGRGGAIFLAFGQADTGDLPLQGRHEADRYGSRSRSRSRRQFALASSPTSTTGPTQEGQPRWQRQARTKSRAASSRGSCNS
jgi:hypothetical protein